MRINILYMVAPENKLPPKAQSIMGHMRKENFKTVYK